MDNIQIQDIVLHDIADGTYTGKADGNVIQVEVEVIINSHQITDIKILKHKNNKGENAEKIIYDIIEQQTIDVDSISGATLSSLMIKDAIQNALKVKD